MLVGFAAGVLAGLCLIRDHALRLADFGRMAAAAQWHSRSTQRSYSSQMKQGLRKLVRAETQKLPELCISLMCQTRLRTAISNKQQLQ